MKGKVYKTGTPERGLDWVFIKKDGTRGYLNISVSLTRDPAGRPIGFSGIGRDVTKRRHMEEELKDSEKNTASCWKTPVTPSSSSRTTGSYSTTIRPKSFSGIPGRKLRPYPSQATFTQRKGHYI